MKSWLTFLALAVPSFGGAIYSVTDLGGLGGASASADSINGGGGVVGWADTPQGNTEGLVAIGGSLQPLGQGSQAFGINNAGQVVGTMGTHGALWTVSGMTDLGAGMVPTAINNSGQIVGGNGQAFLMSSGSGASSMQDLGTL